MSQVSLVKETTMNAENPVKKECPFSPKCDQWVTPSGVVYCFDLPGVRQETIEVIIHRGTLHLSGHRPCLEKGHGKDQAECPHGKFERTLTLPECVNARGTIARYHDGILKIEVPFASPSTPVRVRVEEPQHLPPLGSPGEVGDEDDLDLDPCGE